MTESEEMYLVTIACLQEDAPEAAIPLSRLAGELGLSPISANQMVRKLEDASLVAYTPYKGVDLTPAGRQAALSILRFRRIWEVFLVERLHFSPAEAETLACRMEHVFPSEGIERLAGLLGNPLQSPQGRLIPAPLAGGALRASCLRLDQLKPGEGGMVERLEAGSAECSFLSAQGLRPGARIDVLAAGSERALLVKVAIGGSLHLSSQVAQAIWVSRDLS
jgi:DtxR family Mn-dependent transcriptional regulator